MTTELTSSAITADFAVLGGGLIGSMVARCLAEAGAHVLVLDAGSPLTKVPGTHVRNIASCRRDRAFHYDMVRTCLRPASVSRTGGPTVHGAVPPMPDGNGINSAQRVRSNMVAARVTTVHGGMGVLWNCVAPRLHPSVEQWPGIPPAEWDRLYRRAEQLLSVGPAVPPHSARQDYLLRMLSGITATAPRPAPVAAAPDGRGALRWTGPAEVLADADADVLARVTVLPQHTVTRLHHQGGRVTGARAVDLGTGHPLSVSAGAFLVAMGGIRTPALLWASDIGLARADASPLGRYLHEHPVVYAQVALDPAALGTDPADAGADPCVVVPVSGRRPFHSLLLCDGYDAVGLEGAVDERLIVSLYWYILAEPRFDNRVTFDSRATDSVGLPQPTFEYSLDAQDRDRVRAAMAEVNTVAVKLGELLRGRSPQLLSPGSSMHLLGTTRMGLHDDGSSVVDRHGRVWAFDNLYLGGTGLLASPTATNPTLAACALGVGTAERMLGG